MDNKTNVTEPNTNNTNQVETNPGVPNQTLNQPTPPTTVNTPNNTQNPVVVPVSTSETTQPLPEQVKKTPNKEAFNSEEKVIYEIKEPKQGNPIIVALFFVALIVFVFFLPNISSMIKKYYTKTPTIPSAPIIDNTKDDEEKITNYKFADAINVAKIGDLAINNVIISRNSNTNEYFASFTAVNNGSKPYTFDKKYYMIFYSNDKIIYRALVHSYDAIDSFVSQEISLPVTQNVYQQANGFLLEEINPDRYPDVNLKDSEDDMQKLTCTYLNTEMTYYFKDNLLEKILETYTTSRDKDSNYDNILQEQTQIANQYNTIDGITSVMENHEETGYFILKNNFDLVNIQDKTLADLKKYRYFKYHETSKTISFEIQTQGYTCS